LSIGLTVLKKNISLQHMSTIFMKIINKEIPAYIVFENEKVIAFLDIFPKQIGHTLIVPKVEVESIYDLPIDYYSEVFRAAKEVAKSQILAFNATKISYLTLGLEVPHAHLHLIPINSEKDIYSQSLTLTKAEFLDILDRIMSHISI
jgi:histidine triad (HIT) family protein